MELYPEHIPPIIFDWIEERAFASLSTTEKAMVLEHLSEYEYNELYLSAFYIRKSMEAGSTSGQQPVKLSLLKTFDHTHSGRHRILPFMNMFWKVAAVFLLFMTGWLCHYLSGYRQNPSEIMADADTLYITQKTSDLMSIFDTIHIGLDYSSLSQEKDQQDHNKLQEKRDATEYIPAGMKMLLPGVPASHPYMREGEYSTDDSLLKPGNT